MPPAPQTTSHHAAIAAKLSAARLRPYLSATEGNVRAALRLYQWNVDWLTDPSHLLRRLVGTDIVKATRRAQAAMRGATPGHPDILAQVSFGTWRFLLPDNDPGRQLLWRAALSSAFPYHPGPAGDLVDDVDKIYKLRNRVAHLEPILNPGMVSDRFGRMRTVLRAIDPRLEQWFISRQRVTPSLNARP